MSCWMCGKDCGNGFYVKILSVTRYLCPTCHNSYVRECVRCGQLFISTRDAAIPICHDCKAVVMCSCSVCGRIIYKGVNTFSATKPKLLKVDVDSGVNVCEACLSGGTPRLHSYSYKPRPIFWCDGTPSQEPIEKCPYMGVEIEVEVVSSRRDMHDCIRCINDYIADESCVYIKTDGSLTYGFEVVSHPMTISDHINTVDWGELFEVMHKSGLDTKNTCGLHVHLSKDCITRSTRRKLSICVWDFKKQIERLSHRTENRFFRYMEATKTQRYGVGSSNSRYEAINWRPRNTVEFRMFNGTLGTELFLGRLEFVHSLYGFCSKTRIGKIGEGGSSWSEYRKYASGCEYVYLDNMLSRHDL